MKKLILIAFTLVIFKCSFSQNLPDLSKWYAYKVYASGLSDAQKADYLARSIEKKNLAVFAAFDEKNGIGYVIIEAPYLMHEIEKYVNNMLTDFHIESDEPLTLDENSFLNIYFLRGLIPTDKQSGTLPKFINLGPNKELANELYALAKSTWIKKYPDAYKASIPAPEPLTPEQQEEIQQKSNR